MPLISSYRLSAGLWAGLVAGIIFLIVELALVTAMGGEPWFAVRAFYLGKTPAGGFSAGIAVAALFFHFIRAIASALVLTVITHKMSLGLAVPVGGIVGAVFYGFIWAIYGATGKWSQAPFPEEPSKSTAILLATYVVFGIAAAVTYNVVARRRAT